MSESAGTERKLADLVTSRSIRGVHSQISGLIRTGDLAVGTRLPTVKATAELLDMSSGTIAEIWTKLRAEGLIETRRRGGSFVTGGLAPGAGDADGRPVPIDLSKPTSDRRLFPDLARALKEGLLAANLHDPQKEYMTERLIEAVRPDWPYAPEAWFTADGGHAGGILALSAIAERGQRVAVESPTNPKILADMQTMGILPVAVDCDEFGPRPDRLAEALQDGVAGFVFQPRTQVPLGHTVTEDRLRELARVLADHDGVCVYEDDNYGPLSTAPARSIGSYLPQRVLILRSYCKTFGVDLRTCVIAGSAALIEKVRLARSLGAGMNSRILQDALAFLLTDPRSVRTLESVRQEYARRRKSMVDALRERGIPARHGEGFILWLEVPDEQEVLVSAAVKGLVLGAGRHCFPAAAPGGYVQIATSLPPADQSAVDRAADILASVLRSDRPQVFD